MFAAEPLVGVISLLGGVIQNGVSRKIGLGVVVIIPRNATNPQTGTGTLGGPFACQPGYLPRDFYRRMMVLLHGFIKKSQKTPPVELKTARQRLAHLHQE